MAAATTLLPIAQEAIDAASELARTSPPGELTPKGDRDYASEVDFTIERTVRTFLQSRTPSIAFVGEEENAKPDDVSRVVDPRPDRWHGQLRPRPTALRRVARPRPRRTARARRHRPPVPRCPLLGG